MLKEQKALFVNWPRLILCTSTTEFLMQAPHLVSSCYNSHAVYLHHCAQCKLLVGQLWGFRLSGDTLYQWEWKLAQRSAKFHPHQCNDKGIGPQNWKFYWNFTKILEYKRPQGRIPCAIFTKLCRVCTSFQAALAVKIWMDLLNGLWSDGVLSWGDRFLTNFQCPLAAKLCVGPQKF